MSTVAKPKDVAELTREEYAERYVPKFPEGKGWEDMSTEERRAFTRASVENHCKRGYDEARSFQQVWDQTPEWEELTDEQRQRIRDEQRRHAEEMREFGESLRPESGPKA